MFCNKALYIHNKPLHFCTSMLKVIIMLNSCYSRPLYIGNRYLYIGKKSIYSQIAKLCAFCNKALYIHNKHSYFVQVYQIKPSIVSQLNEVGCMNYFSPSYMIESYMLSKIIYVHILFYYQFPGKSRSTRSPNIS